MKALLAQTKSEIKRFDVQAGSIETVFIGGGTPSCVTPHAYQEFFKLITPYLAQNAEITTEANPNSATSSWLQGMHDLGVNRVSFGVQSFDAEKLTFLNRSHTPAQAQKAIINAKDIGFKNISLDLIYGTALDNKALLEKDLKTAFSLPINHLSAYALTIEANTPFYKTPSVAHDDENLAFWFVDQIKKKFPQYEISNFGTTISQHNLGYWQYKDYLGIGSGAVGFLKDRRFYTQKDVASYIKDPLNIRQENLSTEDIKQEKILLGLRSIAGLRADILNDIELEQTQHLIDANKLYIHKGNIFNSNFFLADELSLYITS